MLQHGHGLFAGDAAEAGEEIVEARSITEILEKRAQRHTSTSEDPRSADKTGAALNGRTG